jgi:hypothetical protein
VHGCPGKLFAGYHKALELLGFSAFAELHD